MKKQGNSQEDFRQAGLYLAHLVRCGLRDVPASTKPEGVSWGQVHVLAARNSVEGISWFGARTCADVPADLRKRWEDEANRTLYRRLAFDVEREQVLAAMDEAGLAHLPLKGILVADYYPRPEMRSMADNDILYGFVEASPQGGFRVCGADEAARRQTTGAAMDAMVRIMEARGYSPESLKVGNHDSFHKEPLFNFEMHRRLVSESSAHAAYYANPWRRARQSADNPLAFSFSDEDEYVYLLAHAFKHFDVSGCGIRSVVDFCVFLDAKGARLDWAYVRGELQELGLVEFEQQMRHLALAAFGDGAHGAAMLGELGGREERGEPVEEREGRGGLEDRGGLGGPGESGEPVESSEIAGPARLEELAGQDRELLLYMLGCGTYGNVQTRVERTFAKMEEGHEGESPVVRKLRYLGRRIIPEEEKIRQFAPVFCEHKALMPLLPFYRLYRLGRRLITQPSAITSELKALRRMGK